MKSVAYLRVSTAQQDVRSQRLAILEYARKHDFRIDDFIEAIASGQASEKRRRLDELMNVLQRGDRLVVSELSRLGRSLGQIVAILDALAKAGVAFVAMKENIRIEGQRDIQTKVMTTLFALFAEVERDLISERPTKGAMCTNGTFPRARRGLFMLLAALAFRLRRGCGGEAGKARTKVDGSAPPFGDPGSGAGPLPSKGSPAGRPPRWPKKSAPPLSSTPVWPNLSCIDGHELAR